MYAIVDIAGQQFKVAKNQKLFVHRMQEEAGAKVSFDKVLLIEDGGKIQVGNPVIKNAAVSAKVLEHAKGDKVLVFKKKRRKGYQKLNGHRQYLTQIEITDINEKAAPKTAAKKESAPKADTSAKKETPKAADKATDTASTATENKPAAKKPAAQKETVKKETTEKSTAAKETKPAAKKTTSKAGTTKAATKNESEKSNAKKDSDKGTKEDSK